MTSKQQNVMNIQLILLLQYTILYIALRIGCFCEARVQPLTVQISAYYPQTMTSHGHSHRWLKMGLKLSALQSQQTQNPKALAVKIQVAFMAFTHANLYFPKASQEPGYCTTAESPLIVSKMFKN